MNIVAFRVAISPLYPLKDIMSNQRTGTEILESIEALMRQGILNQDSSPVQNTGALGSLLRKRESESIGELYKALAAAQRDFRDLYKSGLIAGRNTPYAKISDLVDASRAALLAHSLVCHTYIITDYDKNVLVTRLVHFPSSQYIESELVLLNSSEEQKRGSSITYAWRYTYAPLIGLVDTSYDDDGEITKPIEKKVSYGK